MDGLSLLVIVALVLVVLLINFLMNRESANSGLMQSAKRPDGSYAQLDEDPALGASEEARLKGVRRYRHGGS